jgi:integrase/recombinase XerC
VNVTIEIGDRLTPEQIAQLAPMMREAMRRDRAHEAWPLWEDVGPYLRAKHRTAAASTHAEAESTLVRLVRFFPERRVEDFEPPIGTERVEEWMEHLWGNLSPATYNKNLSIVREFFKWHRRRGRLQGDPTLVIDTARKRQAHREVYSDDQRRSIVAAQESRRDRIALRLLFDYGLRKGALRAVQIKHFDYQRKRLTIFTKGAKVRNIPIPSPAFWTDLEHYILEHGTKADHYLMAGTSGQGGARRPDPSRPMGAHGLHSWWYRRLAEAGIVPKGVESGQRMHKARHTAGQRVLDKTGNLKATQQLLGHASIQTTGDIYTDWDEQALAATMAHVLGDDDE